MINVSSDLLKLAPYSTDAYETYSYAHLTACSVFLLQEWGLLTTWENISVINHRLFPSKFSMVGWPQFPDANRTNRSLLQLRPKYRNWSTSWAPSKTNKGVFLNERGVAEAKAILSKLGSPKIGDKVSYEIDSSFKPESNVKRKSTITPEEIIKKIRNSMLFKMYSESRWQEAETIDLINFLGVYDHTPSKEKENRLKIYKNAAQELDDADVLDFIRMVHTTFSNYLSRKEK